MKKLTIAALAAATVLTFAIPAAAETFTSANGVISIDYPNASWKEMNDPSSWIVLSDGANLITIDHFANGEKLPEMSVANDHYVNVYQAVFSTQNEVFVITGSVVDAAKIPEVCNAILSANVLQFNTKVAVKNNNAVQVSDFTVVPMDVTMYATANVNVRGGCSTNDQILGALTQGASVKVKGSVQRGGKDFGWYQVEFNGKTGFVSAEFLSKNAPATAAASTSQDTSRSLTGNVKTIFSEDGSAITIYQAMDGNWYDKSGTKYEATSDYEFASANSVFSTNKPQDTSVNAPLTDGFTAYWGNSNTTTLTPYSDGFYYSTEWVRYTDNHDGTYTGADGTTLYDYDPISGTPEDALESDGSGHVESPDGIYTFVSQETGEEILVSAENDGSFYDNEGMEYTATGEGDYVDEEGEEFDMVQNDDTQYDYDED